MSYQDHTFIWACLQGRKDIDNVVCEVVGRSTLASRSEIDNLLELLCVLKVVFDLQRMYLQPRRPSESSCSLVLPPLRIAQLLIAVLERSRNCSKSKRAEDVERKQALEIHTRQVVLAGARAIVLIRQKCPNIHEALWEQIVGLLTENLTGWPVGNGDFDEFTRQLKESCIASLLEDCNLTSPTQQCWHDFPLDLPDLSEDLQIDAESVIRSVRGASTCIESFCEKWNEKFKRNFWVWIDARLALIAAFIQALRSGNMTQHGGSSDVATMTQLHELASISAKVEGTIGPRDQEGRLSSYQNYLAKLEPIPHSLIDYWVPDHLHLDTLREQNISMPLHVTKPLWDHLRLRTIAIVDSDGGLRRLGETYHRGFLDWTSDEHTPSSTLDSPQVAFVLNCRLLHAVAYESLSKRIFGKPGSKGSDELRNSLSAFEVDIICPRCPNESQVSWVRRIDPLYDIGQEIQKSLKVEQTTAVDISENGLSETKISKTEKPLPDAPQSGQTVREEGNRRSFLSTTDSSHTRELSADTGSTSSSVLRLRNKFKKSTPTTVLPEVTSALSTDGLFLMAWTSTQISCYDIPRNEWCPSLWINDIIMAAGAGDHVVVISEGSAKFASTLAVYSRHNSEKVQEPTEIAHRARSVAMSRDGMQIAVGFDEILRFYSVQDGSCDEFDLPKPKHHLPKPLSVDSQSMSFSADAVRLVVATRYFENGDVYAGIYEKDGSPRTRYFKAEPMPSRFHKDFRLSSIVSHRESDFTLLCASTDRNHTTVYHQPSPGKVDIHKLTRPQVSHPIDRVQCAAVKLGSPATFVVVNDANQVFSLKHTGSGWECHALSLHSGTHRPAITKREEKMSIAIMKNGMLRLSWIQDGQGRLVTQDQNGLGLHKIIKLDPFRQGSQDLGRAMSQLAI